MKLTQLLILCFRLEINGYLMKLAKLNPVSQGNGFSIFYSPQFHRPVVQRWVLQPYAASRIWYVSILSSPLRDMVRHLCSTLLLSSLNNLSPINFWVVFFSHEPSILSMQRCKGSLMLEKIYSIHINSRLLNDMPRLKIQEIPECFHKLCLTTVTITRFHQVSIYHPGYKRKWTDWWATLTLQTGIQAHERRFVARHANTSRWRNCATVNITLALCPKVMNYFPPQTWRPMWQWWAMRPGTTLVYALNFTFTLLSSHPEHLTQVMHKYSWRFTH